MAKKEIGDLEEIRQALEGWLAKRLNVGDIRLGDLKFPEESGESSVTLLLDVEVKNEPAGESLRFVCRMQPKDNALFDTYDLSLQYRLMEIAGENDVPVPGLVGYEQDASLVGTEFYVMNFTDGLIPFDNPPYAFGSWVTELSDAQRTLMWRNGLEAMAKVHSIEISNYSLASLPRSAPGQSPLQHEIDKFTAMLDEETLASIAPWVPEALEYLRDNAPTEVPLRLCWGDSRVGNIIWQDLSPAAVIDWEMASLCDPLMDVSWWYWIDYVNSVGLGVERLGGLPDRSELYQQWHELTGLPIDKSTYYDLFNTVRYAIILEKKFLEVGLTADMGGENSFASAAVVPLLAEVK